MPFLLYKITNTENDKLYVGQTITSLKRRFADHKCITEYKMTVSISKLKRAMVKYGKEKFSIHLLAEYPCQESLDEAEQLYIELYDAIESGYNLRTGGAGGGLLHESSKALIREKRKLQVMSPEHMKALGAAAKISNEKQKRPVSGKCIDTNEVIYFLGINEVKMAGFSPSHIHRCANGTRGRKIHRGFIWTYGWEGPVELTTKERINELKTLNNNKVMEGPKAVIGRCRDSGFLIYFPTTNTADKFGFSSTAINKCVRGHRKSHKNYTWEYASGL